MRMRAGALLDTRLYQPLRGQHRQPGIVDHLIAQRIDLSIGRQQNADIVPQPGKLSREGSDHIGESARLRKGYDLGGHHTDLQGTMIGRRSHHRRSRHHLLHGRR